MVSRLILICGLAMYQPAAVPAQSSDTVPEALRRLFESIPAPRLPDSLGFAKAGVIAMDGEGIVRIRPDAARIRVGVVSEGASPTEVAQENATRMSSVVDAVKKSVGEPALSVAPSRSERTLRPSRRSMRIGVPIQPNRR